MASDLTLSPSQVHASLRRLERSRLVLLHGVKYAFPAIRGEVTRGTRTAYAAAPLSKVIDDGGELPPVWPDAARSVWGLTLDPAQSGASRCEQGSDALRASRARRHAT